MNKQTIEMNGLKVTIEQTTEQRKLAYPASDNPPYSPQVAAIINSLAEAIQQDWAPNAVAEVVYDDLIDRLHKFASPALTANPLRYQEAISSIASACEDFANALINIECADDCNSLVSYLSRRADYKDEF